jgi:D-ribose pyranose/furanose isomerase RbsD
MKLPLAGLAILISFAGCKPAAPPQTDWQSRLSERIAMYGHRNWIVIADSAYPAQSRDGIETIVTSANQMQAVQAVLQAVGASRHVKPIVYTDQELKFVPEKDAPGVSAYRQELSHLTGSYEARALPHEEIIAKLDDAAKTFRVLIIKTNMTIPYTSVFLNLDCAYWNADEERALRAAMARVSGQ